MTRRLIILTAILCLSAPLLAAPRPRPQHRRPHGHRLRVPHVPWQTILAGGAAAGGVVFAYKVADGIQKGTMEAARSAPETFIGKCGGVPGTMQAASAVCVLVAIGYLAWRVGSRPDSKGEGAATDANGRYDGGDDRTRGE